jgi:hypothetical protein
MKWKNIIMNSLVKAPVTTLETAIVVAHAKSARVRRARVKQTAIKVSGINLNRTGVMVIPACTES